MNGRFNDPRLRHTVNGRDEQNDLVASIVKAMWEKEMAKKSLRPSLKAAVRFNPVTGKYVEVR